MPQLSSPVPANSIFVIRPYKYYSTWVFDDPAVGLVREAFVSGADTIIERLVADIPGAKDGFTLTFSAQPFPGHQIQLERVREESGGNWYYCPDLTMEGWLCPALFKYFKAAPEHLYAGFGPG
jgi:hypothetical protein